MTGDLVPTHDQMFRLAIETDDYALAEASLQQHIAWVQAGSRTLDEIEGAKELLQWGLKVARARRAHIAEALGDLVLVKKVMDGYAPRAVLHAWRIDC